MNEKTFSWAHGSQENKYKGVRNKLATKMIGSINK